MEVLQIVSISLGILMTTLNILVLCNDKFREAIFKSSAKKKQEKEMASDQRETDKCLLRDAILTNYRMHKDKKEWSSDEYENFEHLYKQYKKLGGNSFVDKLWKEVQSWKIIL